MEKLMPSSGLPVLATALALGLLLVGTPEPASATAGAPAAGPCPSSIQVDGRTAHLSAFICGSLSASVGIPWPVSIGVTVGHCTGCECGYMWDAPAGGQFTRRAAGDCGWGGSGGSASGEGDGPKLANDGCQWGRDYVGWEPAGC